MGPLRPPVRQRRPLQGLRPARPAHRLGREPRPRLHRAPLGRAGLHHHRELAADHGPGGPRPRARAPRGWLDERADLFRYAPPEAGAILWTRYALELGSAELAERLRAEESTLVCAGAQFGVEHHLRLGFGPERESLLEGLARLERLVGRVRARAVP